MSIVHASLSLHVAFSSFAVKSLSPHPVTALHTGFWQMSSDVHCAPMFSASQPLAVALHVYTVHCVLLGHGSVATSAQYRRGLAPTKLALHAACSPAGNVRQPATELMHTGVVQNVAALLHGNSAHAHPALKSDEYEQLFDPLGHDATLHDAGLHNASTVVCNKSVYLHPVAGSHVSFVH